MVEREKYTNENTHTQNVRIRSHSLADKYENMSTFQVFRVEMCLLNSEHCLPYKFGVWVITSLREQILINLHGCNIKKREKKMNPPPTGKIQRNRFYNIYRNMILPPSFVLPMPKIFISYPLP